MVDIGDRTVPAKVVYYNPDVDVAILGATGTHRPLQFDLSAGPGAGVAILGYPRTARTTCSPAASGPSSGCAHRTSTGTAR